MLNIDLSEILIALWKLKYKVETSDLPNLLDEISKSYLIENAKETWNYQKAKKKLYLNKIEPSEYREVIKNKPKTSENSQKIHDKSGFLKILSFKSSLKKFENNLENNVKNILEVKKLNIIY